MRWESQCDGKVTSPSAGKNHSQKKKDQLKQKKPKENHFAMTRASTDSL